MPALPGTDGKGEKAAGLRGLRPALQGPEGGIMLGKQEVTVLRTVVLMNRSLH